MTVAVGARFKGGLVLASESRLLGYSANPDAGYSGTPDNDAYPKAFELPQKKGAFAVAGELQIYVALGADPTPQLVIEATRLIRSAFALATRDYREVAKDAVRVISDAAKLVKYSGSLEILIGLQLRPSPVLWSISRRSSLGKDTPPVLVESNPHALGIGEYHTYVRYQASQLDTLKPIEREKIRNDPPPPLPSREFDVRAEAEDWVRAVIAWCCRHSHTCGGPVVMKAYGP